MKSLARLVFAVAGVLVPALAQGAASQVWPVGSFNSYHAYVGQLVTGIQVITRGDSLQPVPNIAVTVQAYTCGSFGGEQHLDLTSDASGIVTLPAWNAPSSPNSCLILVDLVDNRSSIMALTTSGSTSGPEPAACERIRLRCNCVRSSSGMCRVASAPNPVDTP